MISDEAKAPEPVTVRDKQTGRYLTGVSGNPGGRPRGLVQVADLARSGAALAVLTLMKVCNDRTAAPHVQMRSAELLLRRGFGKAPSPAAGGVGRWPGLVENVERCLDSFVREEGTDAVAAPKRGGPRQR